jgi:redox-sensitive bicupin YhaK (pirin superfamily)
VTDVSAAPELAVKALLRVIDGQRTSDGAGVTLYRSLGQSPHVRLDPFLMLDEFGSDQPNEYIAGFPAHPHRGFQTVTYMLAGHMLHEDHLGNRGHLESGGVQWMTAGRGIIHSEMPQQDSGLMRGFQLWINLPAREKMRPAEYQDLAADSIPVYDEPSGLTVKIIAGVLQRAGVQIRGPIAGVSTQPVFWDVHLPAGGEFHQPLDYHHNTFVYVYEGELEGLQARQGGIFGVGAALRLRAPQRDTRCLVLAAKPIGEPVVQYGPFVMNTREEIDQAISDYRSGRLVATS